MMRAGVFVTEKEVLLIYEIDEPGFYRIDFLREGGRFQTDPDAVIYSQVQKKILKYYGDRSVYTRYVDVLETVANAQMRRSSEEKWENGVYVSCEKLENTKMGYYSEIRSENGVPVETFHRVGDATVSLVVTHQVYGVKMEPVNFKDYKTLSVLSDTVTDTVIDKPYYDMDTLCRRYDLQHIESKDYVVVQSEEEALDRLKRWVDSPAKFKSCDTETTGLDVDIYGEDCLVGIILSEDVHTATYYPYRHKLFWNMSKELLDKVIIAIQSQSDKLVGANIKFDRKVFLKEGYDVVFQWDVTQLSIVEHPFLERGVHTLKQRATEANGKFFLGLEHIFINKSDIDFSILPIDIVKYYACPDGTNTLDVFFMLMNKIPKFQWKLAQLESKLANVKADMEFYGMRVNVRKYEVQYNNCNYIIDKLLKAFRTLTRSDCNINSNQELSDLIYNKMHCEVLSRTGKGVPSTATLALNKLANEKRETAVDPVSDIVDMFGKTVVKGSKLSESKYPALVILSKYREYVKLQTSFYARFERTMRTGRVFFWVNQNGAASGRQSSPMHQLPPELKAIMISDSAEHDMWGPDFSQIEIRMIAYLAGEKDLIAKCCDPDNDIHRVIGSLISGKDMWAITPEERNAGKRRNFGFVYLISGYGLAKQVFETPKPSKDQVEFAQKQLDALFHRFKYINRYIKRNAQEVQQNGFMETAWYHRYRYFKEIFDKDLEPRKKQSILRMANNMPVQGTAADYLKVAEVQMFEYIREKGWHVRQDNGFPLVRLMLSIHDEILISAHRSVPKEEIVKMIKLCMETPVKDAPPFFASPALMDNWEGHSDDSLAMPIKLRDQIVHDYDESGTRVFFHDTYDVVFPEEITKADSSLVSKDCPKEVLERIQFVNHDIKQLAGSISMKDRIAAVQNYIDFSQSTYVKTNYREVLADYRKTVLKDYMSQLIKEYGSDYTVVGEHVRHPSLTHQLLDVYKDKLKSMNLTHEEAITTATKFYLEDLEGTGFTEVKVQGIADDKRDKNTHFAPIESLINIDENGEVIYESNEDITDDDYEYMSDAEIDLSQYRLDEAVPYVWELADSILFDVQDMKNQDDVNAVLSYIFNNRADDGFFKTYIIYNGQAVDTHLRVENMDIKCANDFMHGLIEKTRS